MNKLFTKIASLSVGLAMAIGLGVALGGSGNKEMAMAQAAATDGTAQVLFNSEAPYSASSSYTTKGAIKFKNSANNSYSDPTRIYKNNVFTIEIANTALASSINGVVIEVASGYTGVTHTWTKVAGSGSLTGDSSGSTLTCTTTGTVTTLTVSPSEQARWNAVTVYYASSGTIVPEPATQDVTLAQFINSTATDYTVKFHFSADIKSFKNGESKDKYGNMTVTDGTNDLSVYGSTATASALAWNSVDAYVFTNPQDFMTTAKTNNMKIGDTVEVHFVRYMYNSKLYAQGIILNVTENQFTVDYVVNNGNCTATAPTSAVVNKGASATMPSALSATGFTFDGWCTTQDGSGTVYSAGSTLSNIQENKTLYGKWTATSVVEDDQAILTGTSLFLPTTSGTAYTTQQTIYDVNRMKYVVAPSNSSNVFYGYTTVGSNGFDTSEGARTIFMGKNGAFIYNAVAFTKKIVGLEVFSSSGCSQSVSIAVDFAVDGPLTSPIESSENAQVLSTQNHVYDLSIAGMVNANYKYFRLQVTNNNNAQIQIRLTLADEQQQQTQLDSITLTHDDLENNILPIAIGTSKTLGVTYDPDDSSVDKSLTWETSDDSVATVANGTISVLKTASVGNEATITATPTDTHAEAKSITVRATAAVAKRVDMDNGITNSSTARMEFVAGQHLTSWPEEGIKVTLTDDSVIYPEYNDVNIKWYYLTSDSGSADTEIDDLSSFVFDTSMKRLRMSYGGKMAEKRIYITVSEAPTSIIVSGSVSGNNDFYVEDMGTIVFAAPEGYPVFSGATDLDTEFSVESNATYDSVTGQFTGDFIVYADEAKDLSVTFYFYTSNYDDYVEKVETIHIINPTGLSEAREFAGYISDVCHASEKDFDTLEGLYDITCGTEAKALLLAAQYNVEGTGDSTVVTKESDTHYELADGMSRYDELVKKHNMNNFMNKQGLTNQVFNSLSSTNGFNATAIIIIISVAVALPIGGYIVIRKKKQD